MSDPWRSSYFSAFSDAGLSPSTESLWGVDQSQTQPGLGKWGSGSAGAVDSKWGVFDPGYDLQDVLNYYNPPQDDPFQGGEFTGQISSPPGQDWAGVNQWDSYVAQASAQYGIPANVIKAIIKIESGGNPNATSYLDYKGLMQLGSASSNAATIDWSRIYDPQYNIMMGTQQLSQKRDAARQFFGREPSWSEVAGFYFGWGGHDGYNSTSQYMAMFDQNMAQLNMAGSAGAGTGYNPVSTGLTNNSFVQEALNYVGVDYVWGGIPGASENPWQTGWDCSGLTFFMDQKYGTGHLPQGSHYQYDYARRTGRLFTDLNQLQPGDLVFIDTGWQGGAGAELNRAGHVGIYIGDGQMLHAANAASGTIVSPLSGYSNILGAMHMSWSGGSGGGYGGGGAPQTLRGSILDWVFGR